MAFAAAGARRPFFRRRKTCPFSGVNAPKIDYKDVRLLQRYISERGKIVPSSNHCGFRAQAAGAGAGDQAGALSRASALCDSLTAAERILCPPGDGRKPLVGTDTIRL